MTDEELRKLVSDTKGLVADELFFKDDAELITGLSDAVLTLLDRVETAEQALQRVRELHRKDAPLPDWPECTHCKVGMLQDPVDWPCPTIRALEGDE